MNENAQSPKEPCVPSGVLLAALDLIAAKALERRERILGNLSWPESMMTVRRLALFDLAELVQEVRNEIAANAEALRSPASGDATPTDTERLDWLLANHYHDPRPKTRADIDAAIANIQRQRQSGSEVS